MATPEQATPVLLHLRADPRSTACPTPWREPPTSWRSSTYPGTLPVVAAAEGAARARARRLSASGRCGVAHGRRRSCSEQSLGRVSAARAAAQPGACSDLMRGFDPLPRTMLASARTTRPVDCARWRAARRRWFICRSPVRRRPVAQPESPNRRPFYAAISWRAWRSCQSVAETGAVSGMAICGACGGA